MVKVGRSVPLQKIKCCIDMKALGDSLQKLQKCKVLYSRKLYDVIIDFVQDPVFLRIIRLKHTKLSN